MEPNLLMRQTRQQSSTIPLPAVGPSTANDDVTRNAAPGDENKLAFWLGEARWAAAEHAEDIKTDEEEKKERARAARISAFTG